MIYECPNCHFVKEVYQKNVKMIIVNCPTCQLEMLNNKPWWEEDEDE